MESDHSAETESKVSQTVEDETILHSSFDFFPYCHDVYVSLTFPAALELAPLSNKSSATSTLPYLEATWSGVKPFYRGTNEEVDTILVCVTRLLVLTVLRQPNVTQGSVSRQVLPSSSWSAEPPCPGGCVRFVRGLPEQRCEGVCGLLWWWSRGWLCAPAAALLAPCGPSERHNAEVFGHPGQRGARKYNISGTAHISGKMPSLVYSSFCFHFSASPH